MIHIFFQTLAKLWGEYTQYLLENYATDIPEQQIAVNDYRKNLVNFLDWLTEVKYK